ncbi:hypothetical protein DL93DRAFT_1718393 [Clavulina sp. PMI_390]|nr:hypothetical protein DL93DRAFT_1718393 [Clavulina sp. PMI_390]
MDRFFSSSLPDLLMPLVHGLRFRAGGVLYYGPPTVATGDPAFVAPTAHPHPYLPVEIGGEPAVAVAQTAPLGAGVAETMGMATSQMDQSPQRALTHELSSESMRMRMPMAVEMSSMLPTPGSGGPPPTPLDRPQNGASTHLPLAMPIAVPVSGDHHHPPGGPAFLQGAAAGEAPSHYPPPHHHHPLVQPQPQAPTPVLPALLSNITLTSPTATRAMIVTAPDPSLNPNDASTSSNNTNPISPVSPTRSRAQRPTIRTALPAGSGDPGRSPQSPNRSPARSYHASAYPYPYLHSPPHWDTPKTIVGTGLAIVSVVSEAGIGASRHVYRRGSVPATVHSARAKQAAAKANAAKAKRNANANVGSVTATPATGDEPENTGHAPLERGAEVEVEEAHYEGVEMEDSETVMRRPASPRSSNGSTTSSFLEEVAKDKTKKIVPLVSVYDSLKGFNTVQPIHSADDAPASAAPEANGNTVERTDAMISTSSAPSISFLPIASTSTTAAANPAPPARPIATPIFVEEAPLNIQAARRVVLARHYSLPSPSHFPDAAAYSAAPGAEYGIISSALAINGPGGHGHGGRRSPRGRAGGSPTAPSPSPTSPSFAGHRQHPYAGTEKERESAGVGVGYAARRRSLADGSESAGNGSANGNNERRKRRARAAGLMVAIASPTGASAAATSTTATITEEPVAQAQLIAPTSLEAANALLPPPVTDSAPYPYDAGAATSSSIPYPSTIGLAAARGAQISPSSFPPSLHYPYQGESVPESAIPHGGAAIGSGFEDATYEAYSYTYHPGAISEVTPGMMASANPALMPGTLPVAVQQPYSSWPVRRVAPSIEFVSTGPLPAADYSFGTAGRRSSSITTAAPNEDVIAGQGALIQEGAGSAEDSGSIHHAGASPGAGSNGATDTTPTQTTPTKDVQASGPSAARRPSSSEYPGIAMIDPTQMTEEEFAELDTAVVQPSQDVAVSIIPRHSRLAAPMANGTMPPPAHPPNYHTTPPFIQTPERNRGVLPHPLDSGAALAFGRAAGFQQGPPSASSSRSAFSMPGSGVVPSRFGSFDSGLDSLTSFENATETESLSLPQAMIVEGGVSGPYDGPQFQDVFEPTKGSDDVVPMHSIQQMMDPRTATTGGTFLPPHPVQSPRAPSSPFTNRLISPVESYALDTRRASCPAPLPPSGGEPSPPNNYVTPAASTTRTDRPPVPSTDWTSIPAANSRQTNAKPATSPIATSSSMPRHFLARMPSAPVIAATNGSSATFDGGPAFDYRPDWERVQPPMLQAYVPPSSEGYTETLVSLGDSPASTSQSGTYAYSPSPITPAWSTDYPSVTVRLKFNCVWIEHQLMN